MSDRDWRSPLLAGGTRLDVTVAGRDPGRWPGYTPRTAVTAWRLVEAIAVAWDFSTYGGSFGEDDATVLGAAVAQAVAERLPVLTLVRSGGTRLQEGMAALVGIPRARVALKTLADAGLAHVSVADAPTTGGVWISVTSSADLRVAVEGATVAFAGPRVVEAFTGTLPGEESHTAESAHAAGLVWFPRASVWLMSLGEAGLADVWFGDA
ncbi:MAG: carboxyl transferase, partial [Frankiales bacterium]|nr:carboxyl transferase [Frankiales bacterium]